MDCFRSGFRHAPRGMRQTPFDQMIAPPRPPVYQGPNPPYNYNYCLYGTTRPDSADIHGFNLFDNYVVQPRLMNDRFLRVYM